MGAVIDRYRFTVEQYHRMGEVGILGPDCRVELLDGDVYEMSPIDPWHAGVVNWLTHRLVNAVGHRAVVHVQNPVGLDPRSEPQPDLMLLRPRADFYRTMHPAPEHALLVIEVANTSLSHDRRRKLPLYARAGVPEVWIVNRRDDAIEVYRDPSPEGFQTRSRHGRGDGVTPHAFADIRIAVSDILG